MNLLLDTGYDTEHFKTRMVTFTGGDFTGERAQAFANGAAERLFKPMGMDERVGVIVRILENSLTYIGNPGR